MKLEWLTTAPNPQAAATGHDAGQRGWKLHAVFSEVDSFEKLGRASALCGLRPAHGWSLDMFIDEKCRRCNKIFRRMTRA